MLTPDLYLSVERECGDVIVASVTTKRVDNQNFQRVASELFSFVERNGRKKYVLNLAVVEYVYSVAFGKLVELDKKVRAAGGELRLCNLHPVLREVLRVTQIDLLLDIRNDTQAALEGWI